MITPDTVISTWMAAGPKRWFTRDEAFDAELRDQFGASLEHARSGSLDGWAATPDGALALILLLDQVSRNIHRGSALAFAGDEKARAIADLAITRGDLVGASKDRAMWLILPFEHHETIESQERAIALFEALGPPAPGEMDLVHWAHVHHDVIARFGRFPHRNAVLGRDTTPEEQAFLDSGGFAA